MAIVTNTRTASDVDVVVEPVSVSVALVDNAGLKVRFPVVSVEPLVVSVGLG